jgi:hypothetical protein
VSRLTEGIRHPGQDVPHREQPVTAKLPVGQHSRGQELQMTTITFATKQQKTWRLPEYALVLGLSLGGLIISLVLAAATWTDGPILGF